MLLNLGLLALEVLAASGLAIALHAATSRYGQAPLIIFVTVLVAALHGLAAAPVFVEVGGFRLAVTDTVIVPAILVSVLMLYEVQGTAAARTVVWGVVIASLLAVGLRVLPPFHLSLAGGVGPTNGPLPDLTMSARLTASSLLAFAFSLTSIPVVHQAIRNSRPRAPRWISPGLALIVALVIDDVVFRLGAFGPATYAASFPGGLPAKVGAGLLLWPLIGIYLSRNEADRGGAAHRPTFDLILGSYRRVEEALQFQERRGKSLKARLETVIAYAPIMLFSIDRDGIFTLSEGAGLKALGLEPGESVGRSVFDLFPEAAEPVRNALNGEAITTTIDIAQASFEVSFVPVHFEDQVSALLGVAVDVTETRRAQKDLEASDARFRSTFTNVGVGLLHTSLESEILLANKAFHDLLGYTEEELIGRTVWDVTFEEDLELSRQAAAKLHVDGLDELGLDKRYVTKDGRIVWCHTTATLARSAAGEPLYHIVSVEDLSERRETEAQLRQAQKMEVVGQLTGGVAHDFNNLLTVVIGGLELAMADKDLPPDDRHPLHEALVAAGKGAALTGQLLAFSRRQSLHPVPVDVAELFASTRTLLKRTLGETIEIEVDLDPEAGACIADRAQLDNALLNVALNARDAMPRGGRLSFSAVPFLAGQDGAEKHGVAPGSYLDIRITDNGPGMGPDELTRAFEPFYTTKEVGRGSGLGLSMVYGFAKQSGGAAHLFSEPGEGLTVRLLLPRSAEAKPARSSPGGPAAARGGGERVLLVEDDPSVREVAKRMLTHLGYEILLAEDGAEALQILDENRDTDLLISDVVLGGEMSGPELAQVVMERYPDLRIIFVSGYTRDSLPMLGEQAKRIPLLSKPFRHAQLASAVKNALDGDPPA